MINDAGIETDLAQRIKNAQEAHHQYCACEKGCEEWNCPGWVINEALMGRPTNKCWVCDEPIPGVYEPYSCDYCKTCAADFKIPTCPECNIPARHLQCDKDKEQKSFECPSCGMALDDLNEVEATT